MEWNNIPAELRILPQWVVSSVDKVPRTPATGSAASVTNPATWGTFEEAIAAGYPNVGFVLTRNDPYAFVDLDQPQTESQGVRHGQILNAFGNTYAELSQSGNGVHIICRGSVPQGVRRDKVEVYSSDRYMICTGRVFRHAPIADAQPVLDVLYREMGGGTEDTRAHVHADDEPEVLSDAELVERAENAENGDKFVALCKGEWETVLDADGKNFPSQSEADHALIGMIAFYTRSNEQVERIFRMTALGKRDKAQRKDYVRRALKKIRANEPPPIDFSRIARVEPKKMVRASMSNGSGYTLEFPPGVVGEIARYIYSSSVRPVREVSIAAALAFVAGLVGRQYNISRTGLNLYIILLAKSGVGKEDAKNGIERIVTAVRVKAPIIEHYMGPGNISSGQALIKMLDEKPCFVSVLGEFGLRLQHLNDPRQATSLMMKMMLLDLYGKSGAGATLRESVYSDKQKNTKVVDSPAVTLLGESTPSTFYEGLSQDMIIAGLVPRFLIIDYPGDRPDTNPTPYAPPPDSLVQYIADLISAINNMEHTRTVYNVKVADDAQELLDAFDRECDSHIRNNENEALRELWNRAHLKSLRLSAILSVGKECVTLEDAQWSISLVRNDVALVSRRFEEGDVGGGEQKALSDVRRIIRRYVTEKPENKMAEDGVIPASFVQMRTNTLKSFQPKPRETLRNIFATLLENGEIQEVPRAQMQLRYKSTARAFVIVPGSFLG